MAEKQVTCPSCQSSWIWGGVICYTQYWFCKSCGHSWEIDLRTLPPEPQWPLYRETVY
jgi:transposase-like protein